MAAYDGRLVMSLLQTVRHNVVATQRSNQQQMIPLPHISLQPVHLMRQESYTNFLHQETKCNFACHSHAHVQQCLYSVFRVVVRAFNLHHCNNE